MKPISKIHRSRDKWCDFERPIWVTPKGICGTLVKEKQIPRDETIPADSNGDCAQKEQAKNSHAGQCSTTHKPTHGCNFYQGISQRQRCARHFRGGKETRLTVSHAHGGEVEGTEFCLQTPQTNRKVTLHSDSIKRMLRQTWGVESGRAPGLFINPDVAKLFWKYKTRWDAKEALRRCSYLVVGY